MLLTKRATYDIILLTKNKGENYEKQIFSTCCVYGDAPVDVGLFKQLIFTKRRFKLTGKLVTDRQFVKG